MGFFGQHVGAGLIFATLALQCSARHLIERQGRMSDLVANLGREVRDIMKGLAGRYVAYRSLKSATGIPLIGIKDIASSSIEIAGIFSVERQALVWIENGGGASLGIALTGSEGTMMLNIDDEFEVALDGGITPETLIRLALSELDMEPENTVSLTLFCDPKLALSPNLVLLDAEFPKRTIAQTGQAWPQIFPRQYYLDEDGRPRNTCRGWAMGSSQPVQVDDYRAVRGCNLFLRQCQMVTPRLH
jgi:hypothetical protein